MTTMRIVVLSKRNDRSQFVRMDLTELKLVLVGNTNVGKTSIVRTAITGSFTDDTTSTLGASDSTKSVQVGTRTVRLQIWDTAGHEKYRGMTPMYYHNAQIALVVYSVAERETFNAVDSWLKSLKDNAEPNIHVFIVGNKTDLGDARCVSTDEGAAKADECGAEFSEVSAKTGFGVGDLFAAIPRLWLERQAVQKSPDAPGTPAVPIDAAPHDPKPCC
jgi:small GTP-binding protein